MKLQLIENTEIELSSLLVDCALKAFILCILRLSISEQFITFVFVVALYGYWAANRANVTCPKVPTDGPGIRTSSI